MTEPEQTEEQPPRKRLILSASQLSTAFDCVRKWWLQRVAKLPEVRRDPDPRTFGDVLHKVAERYLSADELGRDPETGLPVELYPKGWRTVVSEFGADKGQRRSISVGEGELIQKLVDASIEQGVLIRSPNGRIESRFDIPLAKTERGAITLMGFRDYVPSRDTIEDHKSVKKNRAPWRKTPKALTQDPQMLIYAYSLLHEAQKRGEPAPENFHLVHNQFIKDPDDPGVRKTKATVTREQVLDYWNTMVVPMALKLIKVREAKEWSDVEDPAEKGVCNKYGGCPFVKICGGVLSVERYTKQISRKNKKGSSACQSPGVSFPLSRDTPAGTGANMNVAQILAAKKAKAAALSGGAQESAPAPTPTQAPPAAKPEPATTAPADDVKPTFVGDVPPWANPECRACTGSGFSSRGTPCRICDHGAKKGGRPQSSAFVIEADEGVIVWTDGNGTDGAVQLVTEEVTTSEAEAPPPPAAKPSKPSKPAKAPEPETPAVDPAPAVTETPKKRGRGRPKKGFTLLVDCHVSKGQGKVGSGSGVIFLDEVIARYGSAMAEELKQDSYYDLNAFDRRDGLCKVAEIMAAEFGTDMVVATTQNTEERELLKALRPIAATVIVGQQ